MFGLKEGRILDQSVNNFPFAKYSCYFDPLVEEDPLVLELFK
jgi:hypothetical protein